MRPKIFDRKVVKPTSVVRAVARECVSINGNLLLQDLTKASSIPYYNLPSYPRRHHTWLRNHKYSRMWSLQGVPMSKKTFLDIEITPKRYEAICNIYTANRNELMILITRSFGLKAHNIHLDLFQLECQSSSQVYDLLKCLLSDVQILGIYRTSSSEAHPHAKQDCVNLQTIMDICVGSGEGCRLGALSCDLRNVDPCQFSPYIFTLNGDNSLPRTL